ncbi:MAG: hypothetical protein ACO1QR_09365 [Chthoniobacteraceae bacterium]
MTEYNYPPSSSTPTGSTGEENLKERAGEALHAVKDQVEDTYEAGEECVRYNPLLAVGVALLGGLIIALVAVPRRRTWRDRYVDEPIERTQAGVVAAALGAGALLKQLLSSAESTKKHAMKDLRGYQKSAKKAVKRAKKKMPF